jgi:hypothetical protein
MNLRMFPLIASLLAGAVAADPTLSDARLQQIAVRWALPDDISHAAKVKVESARTAFEQKQIDAGAARWASLASDTKDPARLAASLDYLLNHVAVARNSAATAASQKVRFYDAQETAVFEHVSTLDKQLSAYGGADVQAVPLREPELADYAPDAEPVKFAPGISAGPKELKASLDRWNARLPEISEARKKAIEDFVHAIRADTALLAELSQLDAKLSATGAQ